MRRCLHRLVRDALDRRDAAAGAALLAELESLPAPAGAVDAADLGRSESLRAEVAALTVAREAEQRHLAALQTRERELDPRVGAAPRVAGAVAFAAALTAGTGALVWWLLRGGGLTHAVSLAVPVGLLGLVGAAYVVAAKWIAANAFGRRALALLVASTAFVVGQRLLAWHLRLPIPVALVYDLLFMAFAAVAAALLLYRRVGWVAAVHGVGAGVSAWRLDWAIWAISICSLVTCGLLVWLAWKAQRGPAVLGPGNGQDAPPVGANGGG